MIFALAAAAKNLKSVMDFIFKSKKGDISVDG